MTQDLYHSSPAKKVTQNRLLLLLIGCFNLLGMGKLLHPHTTGYFCSTEIFLGDEVLIASSLHGPFLFIRCSNE